ncbi:unnamed protein product [Leptidea sinapis]|uniref:Uncharacterized protein n=1 Tax=Leptidea sinapis TaxID=189913 RepID=A0A5E4PXS5_9NEOP|nr:unnamed protein product [Leptidea sinapis]
MYSWYLSGIVVYSNGFVNSIEMVNVPAVSNMFTRRVNANYTEYFAGISATLDFDNVKLGMDVSTNIEGIGEGHYTGFNHNLMSNSYSTWANDILLPIVTRKVEKYEFPEIRFDGC